MVVGLIPKRFCIILFSSSPFQFLLGKYILEFYQLKDDGSQSLLLALYLAECRDSKLTSSW